MKTFCSLCASERFHSRKTRETRPEKIQTNAMKTTNLSTTQKAALLHFAGITPRTIQTNHQLNGESACAKKGLIRVVYSGINVTKTLTEAGAAMVAELSR